MRDMGDFMVIIGILVFMVLMIGLIRGLDRI
jgi:hypothetical protein